jgi:hypothetical protein
MRNAPGSGQRIPREDGSSVGGRRRGRGDQGIKDRSRGML